MSIFKDLSESHEILKGIAITAVSSPLWFLSIFFINKPFYDSTDLIIKIILSVSLSVIVCLYYVFGNISEKNKKAPFSYIISVSASFIFFWKAILLFTVYSVGFLFDTWIYYYWYIVIFFIPIIISLLIRLVSKK